MGQGLLKIENLKVSVEGKEISKKGPPNPLSAPDDYR